MAEYVSNYVFQFATEGAMLTGVQWIRDNYGTKVHSAQGEDSLYVRLDLVDVTFEDMVNTITAVRAQFASEIQTWAFAMQ